MLAAPQDDGARQARELIEKFRSDNVEDRAHAARALSEMGEAALPELRRSAQGTDREVAARCAEIAAAIEWAPYVPLGQAERDPSIVQRLASGDPAVAGPAYDQIIRHGGLRRFLDAKILRDGLPALKRRVLASIEAYDIGRRPISDALDVLVRWDNVAHSLAEDDVKELAQAIALSVRAEHRPILERLAKRQEGFLPVLGNLGGAALGVPEAHRVALEELRSGVPWRRISAARAFKRAPNREAAPLLRDLLGRGEPGTILAVLDAIQAYPDLDVKADLVNLLSMRNAEVQAEALCLIAGRKIDESKNIWELSQKGLFHYDIDGPGFSSRMPGPESLQGRLAQALLVADDPTILERMQGLKDADPWTFSGFYSVVLQGVPPRVEERLRAIAEGKEKVSDDLTSLALDYSKRSSPPTPDRALSSLEAGGSLPAMREALSALAYARDLSPDQRERYHAACRRLLNDKNSPLRGRAAIVLHGLKVPEAMEVLLELAAQDKPDSMSYFWALAGEERARPIFRKTLASGSDSMRGAAAHVLSRMKDESVPSAVLDMFRQRQQRSAGHSLGYILMRYPERDFTEDLLAILDETTPREHVGQILVYLHWRGRKDKVEIVRPYVGYDDRGLCGDSSSHIRAIKILGDWGDAASFRLLADRLASPAHDGDVSSLLTSLMQIDPDRAWPHLLGTVSRRDYQWRWAAYYSLLRTASPRHERLVMRLLRSDPYAHAWLPQVAGRLRYTGADEVLLGIAETGQGDAALGLAYLGEPAAIPVLMEHLDGVYGISFLGALDYIVHRDRYPSLLKRSPFGIAVSVPFEEAKDRIRNAFGAELAHSPRLDPPYFEYEGEESLLEWLERNCRGHTTDGRFTHLLRNGRIEFVPLDEARIHWRRWWEQAQKKGNR